MENWREFVNEENERVILTEEELNELLQEISALKSFMGRMRGGKKFGEHGYGWEAAVEQWEEEDAQKAAQSLGLSGVNTKEDFKAKVQDTIKKAEKSGDPRAKEAIKDLTVDIEKIEPEEPTGVPEIVPEPPPVNGAAVVGPNGAPAEPPLPGEPEVPPVEPPIPGGEEEEHVTSVPGAVVGQADKNELRMTASMLADPYGGGRLKALGLSPEEMAAIRQLLNDWAKGMNMQLMEQFLRVLEATRFQPVDPPKARQPRRVQRQEIPQPNLQPLDLAQIYDIIEDPEKARLAAAMIAQNLERVGVRALNWRGPPVRAGEEEEIETSAEDEEESEAAAGEEEAEGEETEEESEDDHEEMVKRVKNVFGATMDIASVASFFGPVGQLIGGAATAASFFNNLTYDPPKYAWAAVDLAALSVVAVTGATGVVKGGAIAAKVGMKAGQLATKVAKGVKLAKSSKGVKAAVGVSKAGKVAKAGYAANTIREELRNDLPADVAEAIEEVLTKKSEEGAYYVNSALDKIQEGLEPDSQGYTALKDFREKIEDLQREDRSAPGEEPEYEVGKGPPGVMEPPPGERPALQEAQLKRWQELAGILHS